jgi:SAM-dependent methyltransferase
VTGGDTHRQGAVEAPTADKATRAASFGSVAHEYERGRPEYPRAAIEWLLGVRPLEVLDLGAGTGKLTAGLLAAGHRVIAVEPLAEMREILEARLPDARALAGTAEQLPLADASVDAVAVGAAFHWFDQRAAQAEIARVLRPAGVLGLLGNGFDTSLPWVARVREILGPPAIERPGHWPTVEELCERFVEVEDRELPHEQRIDRAGLRDLASSRSSLAIMSDAQRADVLARLDRIWEQPELAGRSDVQLPWRTRVRRCRRLRRGSSAIAP